jgi:hypothetical protein
MSVSAFNALWLGEEALLIAIEVRVMEDRGLDNVNSLIQVFNKDIGR